MNEMAMKAIRKEAAEIREKLRGSKVYGEPMTWDNLDTVIVAAYHAGFHDATELVLFKILEIES